MVTLCCLPSLLFGTLLSGLDIRTRRVPRLLVLSWLLAQCAAWAFLAWQSHRWHSLAMALMGALGAMVIQLALALARPGALGLGDVSAALPLGCLVGWFGFDAFVAWWLCMACLGALWVGAWRLAARRTGKVPFVPPMVCAALVAPLLA